MRRRKFLTCWAGGLTAGMLGDRGGPLLARLRRHRHVRTNSQLERIGVSSWSFHNDFSSTQASRVRGSQETIALLDFPQMAADRYKIQHLEFVAPHFGSTQPACLQEWKDQVSRAHSHLENICVDVEELRTEGGLSAPQGGVRERAVQASKTWINMAARLRARSVRCDPGRLNPENLGPPIDSYQELAA